MNLKTTLTLFIAGIALTSQAQLSGYEKVYYQDIEVIDTDVQNVSAKNIVAQADHCKLGLRIENKSEDFLFYNPSETVFIYPFGDKKPAQKAFLIKPHDSKLKTIKVDGGTEFLQPNFKLFADGVYKVPVEGIVEKADDFQLPASTNSFKAGSFDVKLKKYKATTDEARAIFECTYNGKAVGLVDASKLSVKVKHRKTGEEMVFANDNKNASIDVVMKGDKTKIVAVFHIEARVVDMQFATMQLMWNDTFVESEKKKLASGEVTVQIDQALTDEKK